MKPAVLWSPVTAAVLAMAAVTPAEAQQSANQTTVIDSIVVTGARRVPAPGVTTEFGVSVRRPTSYRDIQRGIETLFSSGQYADVRVAQANVNGKEVLRIDVVERPLLTNWTVRGPEHVPEGAVRGKVTVVTGRPYDPSEARRSLAAIDSLYKKRGYYFATGNAVKAMKTKTEGFWWWRKGAYNEEQIERDLRERLPAYYGEHGHPDFEVLRDTLVVDEKNGKGTLIVSLDEGPEYQVGEFEVAGNRRVSTEQLRQLFPCSSRTCGFLGLVCKKKETWTFDQKLRDDAIGQGGTSYYNTGYI